MAHLDADTLSAYIDEELPPEETGQVEEHLASCAACNQEYQELLGVATLVRQLPAYSPRKHITIDDGQPSGGAALARIIEFSKPLAVAAIVLVVAFAGLRIVNDLVSDDSDEQESFSALQEAPPGNGTETLPPTSETVAADRAADPGLQEASEQEAGQGAAAPAAEEQRVPTATVEATVPSEAPEGDPDGTDGNTTVNAAIIIVVVVIIGGAIWLSQARRSRR